MFTGYKCFKKGLVNRYGIKFEIGKIYHCDKEIKFGNDGHGFHMCKRMEDTFRYFDAFNNEIDICLVTGYGKYDTCDDDYYDYYDMYAFEYMTIDKVLSREEIIAYGLSLDTYRVRRFIQTFKLSPKEIIMFKKQFKNDYETLNYLAYYQDGNVNAFDEKYTKQRKL